MSHFANTENKIWFLQYFDLQNILFELIEKTCFQKRYELPKFQFLVYYKNHTSYTLVYKQGWSIKIIFLTSNVVEFIKFWLKINRRCKNTVQIEVFVFSKTTTQMWNKGKLFEHLFEIFWEWYVFFYKHNAYKHIQPGISEKNKHMLSILSSLENSCSLLFSCLKSHSEAYSELC